jgi:hypothetical protein
MKTRTIALTALLTSIATATLVLAVIVFGPGGVWPSGPVPAQAAGTPQVLSLSGADFQPGGDGADYTNFWGPLVSNNAAWYAAPVHLPQGAQVNKVAAYGLDNGGTAHSLIMYRHNLGVISSVEMASITSYNSFANPNKIMDTSIASPTIDNSQAAYYIMVYMTGADQLNLRGVKINYLY